MQGGFIGINRKACVMLHGSKCLDRADLANPDVWRRGDKRLARERVRLGLLSFDWLLAWGMRQIGIHGYNFTEVLSQWRDPVPNDVDVAVAHPCKDIPVLRAQI